MSSSQIANDLPPPPRGPAGPSPLRRPQSVRRTSSIDMTWPEGYGMPMQFRGHARDIYTPAGGGAPVVVAEDRLQAVVAQDRTILEIGSLPMRTDITNLVGQRGGGYLRTALDEALPAERDAGSPLYLLIDDLSGTSLIAGWAWSRWKDDWMPKDYAPDDDEEARATRRRRMESICTGFRPGSSALEDIRSTNQNHRPVVPLPHPDDPEGWHELTLHTDTSMRRARRIDVWCDDLIHIDATFQDSASVPAGGREAIHEYLLQATADPRTMTLLSVQADPRILPYLECPAAADNVGALVGVPLRELRTEVLERLRRIKGCTHLNDALRALAEVPVLVEHLRREGVAA